MNGIINDPIGEIVDAIDRALREEDSRINRMAVISRVKRSIGESYRHPIQSVSKNIPWTDQPDSHGWFWLKETGYAETIVEVFGDGDLFIEIDGKRRYCVGIIGRWQRVAPSCGVNEGE